MAVFEKNPPQLNQQKHPRYILTDKPSGDVYEVAASGPYAEPVWTAWRHCGGWDGTQYPVGPDVATPSEAQKQVMRVVEGY